MNETLREKEELTRIDAEQLRKAREEIAILRRKVDQHSELMSEKDRTVQVNIICAAVTLSLNNLSNRFYTTKSALHFWNSVR